MAQERSDESAEYQDVVIMRHGERRDGHPASQPENDPPLTESGKKDIVLAAEKIQKLFPFTEKNVQLISSPFLRARETAQELQKNGVGVWNQIKIDNTLSEVFGPIRIKTGTVHEFADATIVQRGSGKMPEWGETLEMASNRYWESLINVFNEVAEENKSRKGRRNYILPVVITHGDALSSIMRCIYPNRVVYSAEYLSFMVIRRFFRGSHFSFRVIHTSELYWIHEGVESQEHASDDILFLPEEIPENESSSKSLKMNSGFDEDDQKVVMLQHKIIIKVPPVYPKGNEGCRTRCLPTISENSLQSSVSEREGQTPQRLLNEEVRNRRRNMYWSSFRRLCYLWSIFFHFMFILLCIISRCFFTQAKGKTATMLFLFTVCVIEFSWLAFINYSFYNKIPFETLNYISLGFGANVDCEDEEVAEGTYFYAENTDFGFLSVPCLPERDIIHPSAFCHLFYCLFRHYWQVILRITLLQIFSIFCVSLFFAICVRDGYVALRAYGMQFSHPFLAAATILSIFSLTVASLGDIPILVRFTNF